MGKNHKWPQPENNWIKKLPVENPAEEYIKQMRKKYHDAKHNCFAYSIETNAGEHIVKYSDDGEPQGTAGAPILKIITEQGFSNIVVIVTRYFGGILLGTGGLVRAYTGATEEALQNATIVNKELRSKSKNRDRI